MRFCLLVALSVLIAACSEQGAASPDANAPVKVEMTQMYITVRNEAGLALNEVSVSIVPLGRSTVFSKFAGRLENGEARKIMLGDFVGRDGTPFSLRVIRPRAVEVKGRDVNGKEYTSQHPWR